MAGIQFPFADPLRIGPGLCLFLALAVLTGGAPLRDDPIVWYADDQQNISEPKERDPNLFWDGPQAGLVRPMARVFHPGRFVRRVGVLFGGDHVQPAANVNRLDEVPNSSWFTNRIGLFPMAPEIVAQGPGDGMGPDPTERWTIVGAKTEGVTPGFRIRDARGDMYLIKFDPPQYPRMASAAAVISGKILHAAGYFVPEDDIVEFKRDDLELGDNVKMSLPNGTKRIMTRSDVDEILDRVSVPGTKTIRAISSKFLKGKPVGPFDWRGRRKDDPNDRVRHEDRRELRGLKVIAGWINHFDTKQHNTLDMFVEEDGGGFVRHHLIDFASTLGTGANGPQAMFSYEYSLDFPAILGRALALGFHEDTWRRLEMSPDRPEVGYFDSKLYDPIEFKPLVPNASFANLTDRDGYWAAKIISAFTDEHLAAIVARGRYQDSASADYMIRTLAERRDRISRYWFDRVTPLDFFRMDETTLRFSDLGAEQGLYPDAVSVYRGRKALVDADRQGGWSEWVDLETTRMEITGGVLSAPVGDKGIGDHPFYAFEFQVNRGGEWSDGVLVYVSRRHLRVVEVTR